MARAYVSIGSNLEPERHVAAALDELAARFGPLETSRVYRSNAVGFEGPPFLNLVAAFDSDADPARIVAELHAIEARHGRRRDGPRFSDRTLDLDLILYGERVSADPPLPRPEVTTAAFVLAPLCDLAPHLRDPGSGRAYGELWATFPREAAALTPVPLDPVTPA